MPLIRLACLLLFFPYALAGADSPFVVNANEEFSMTIGRETVESFISLIYAPLGIKPSIVFLPNLRGLHMVNDGHIDAEFARYQTIGQAYPNLIKITEPLVAVNAGLFCMTPEQCDLAQTSPYIITKRSITIRQYCLDRQLSCQPVARDNIAFNIMSKRASIYLSEYQIAVSALCSSSIKRIYYRHIPALSRFSYHWINVKHKSLAGQLAESIKQLKQTNAIKEFLLQLPKGNRPCQTQVIPLPPLKQP